jgi:outer membrane protein TolC
MTSLALKIALKNSQQYAELKDAQARLEQARNDYEFGNISRTDYIRATEECIATIRDCSPPYSLTPDSD